MTVGIQHFSPVLSFRGSPAWEKDLSDWMEDLGADTSMPFSFFFAFHRSSLPFMTMSRSFEHTATLPIYYQTPPTSSSLGYIPSVYTS